MILGRIIQVKIQRILELILIHLTLLQKSLFLTLWTQERMAVIATVDATEIVPKINAQEGVLPPSWVHFMTIFRV